MSDDNQKSVQIKCRLDKELFAGRSDATESWRIFKIMAELVSGFELLERYGLAATIFGSARSDSGDRSYQHATELSARLSKAGFAIITGGGCGIMEAANKGAHEAGGDSVGVNIKLPKEQSLNKYVTDSEDFDHFFTRKVMLSFASEVYVFFPGGFGTLDEFFEILTLVQTGKIPNIPIVLVGEAYWKPLLSWIKTDLEGKYQMLNKEDMELYKLVDTIDEAYDLIIKSVKNL